MAFIVKGVSATGFRGTQILSLPLRISTRHSPLHQLQRFASTLTKRTVCQCGAELPKTDRVISVFRERRLGELAREVKCPYFNSFQFTEANDCELVTKIERIAAPLLEEFLDVVYIGSSQRVLLEALHQIPEGDFGDLTGDHGKQLAKFLRDCLDKKLISAVGAVFDIGGQNTSTVNLISDLTKNQNLPCIIVDVNSITPALAKRQPNVKYVIEDGRTFFASQAYEKHTRDVVNKNPSLFIFNNMLNVLKAEDGWDILEAAWERLRIGDYLVISGLVPEQLEKHGFIKYHEVDGIVEFHHSSKGFYKSALASDFFEYVRNRLNGASILLEETFKFSIESQTLKTMDVKGRRLLTLKKTT
jgi:hypothetical protein